MRKPRAYSCVTWNKNNETIAGQASSSLMYIVIYKAERQLTIQGCLQVLKLSTAQLNPFFSQNVENITSEEHNVLRVRITTSCETKQIA